MMNYTHMLHMSDLARRDLATRWDYLRQARTLAGRAFWLRMVGLSRQTLAQYKAAGH